MNTNQAEDHLDTITEKIQEGIRQGTFTWKEIQESVVEKTKAAAQTTDAYVHENPWKVIGLAAGLGLVIGLLLGNTGSSNDEMED